ncbi:MAG: hypothetical protein JW715_13865 [Sedimentisphaerales bacterium]|nr:hypothetical protein [Sedimentisphaerales bacterium]
MTRRFSLFNFTRVDAFVLALVCLFFTAIAHLALSRSRDRANRITCQNNLFEISAGIQIYTNDYDGKYPRSGGLTSLWASSIANFMAPNRYMAYQLASDDSGGYVTISSSLYLLIKYAGMSPDPFVCPGDYGVTVFNLADEDLSDRTPADLWDFGHKPSSHYSYAYHLPFYTHGLSSSSEPNMAVIADRNPWMSPDESTLKNFDLFDPDGDRQAVKAGNAFAHEDEGQNVLFVDGHVNFEEISCCGVENDNIYTYWNGGDIRIGGLPTAFVSQPQDSRDSLLVNDSGMYKGINIIQPKDVNSSDLTQTSIIPTLDYPLPEQQNLLWCSAFQMAWDKLKNDVIGEPVEVIGDEELATYLNRALTSQEDIEEESYYANAGITGAGVIEQIQTDMTQRFPERPVSFDNEEYDTDPNFMILAYSYLNVNAEFEYPFFTNVRPFTFRDSNNTPTKVTSFCNFYKIQESHQEKVNEQVDILFGEFNESGNSDEFAVDLCKYTQPYQVILAVVPRQGTFDQMISYVDSKTLEFQLDPNYAYLSELNPSDELIIPDVIYKMTLCFTELEGKAIGNQPWCLEGYFIWKALQMIDFSLIRTSIIQTSTTHSRTSPILNGRNIYFNKPFLIYVKKRGDNFSPFLVMWVDNAELLNEFK